MDPAQHPALPPEGDSPACPLCRLPLQAREDGDGGRWTHQCLECGQVYTVGERVKMLRPHTDKRLRPTDTGPAVGGVKPEMDEGFVKGADAWSDAARRAFDALKSEGEDE